uniref:Plac8 onzin related protein 6 n=1 Tax=Oryzias melastigma TaxID=30732 RepID=A0A3B3BKY4_ORYME
MACAQYINQHRDKPSNFWTKVIWSDETKIALFDHNHKCYTWRRVNKAYDEINTNVTVKHEDGLLMVWRCCYGFWCGPCLACTVSGRFRELYCLPACDVLALLSQLMGVPLCVLASPIFGITISVPPVAVSMRAAMRNRYGIKGSIAEDVAASCFCWWCAWCQMYRELKHRMKTPVVINVQQQNVINMQPAAMMMPTAQMMPTVQMMPKNVINMQPAAMMMPTVPMMPAVPMAPRM